MNADDVRKMLDSVFDKMSPTKAQEMAKGLLGEDRREQAQKLAADLMDSAQRNRDRVKELISREVASQVKNMGMATQKDLDALKRRVRDLERGGSPAARGSTSRAAQKTSQKTSQKTNMTTAKKPSTAAKLPAAKRSSVSGSSTTSSSGS